MQADISIIAHDLPAVPVNKVKELGEKTGASLVPVQHHEAHIAATFQEECIGIAIDGSDMDLTGPYGAEDIRGLP